MTSVILFTKTSKEWGVIRLRLTPTTSDYLAQNSLEEISLVRIISVEHLHSSLLIKSFTFFPFLLSPSSLPSPSPNQVDFQPFKMSRKDVLCLSDRRGTEALNVVTSLSSGETLAQLALTINPLWQL